MVRTCAPSLLLMLASCSPQLEPIRWEGQDVEALREAIAEPTGVVDRASIRELAGNVARSADAYWSIARHLREVFLTAPSERSEPAWVIAQARGGTSVYLLVACPGDGDAPPFSAGSFRVDSPTLSAELVSTFEVRGELLLSFEDCQVGRSTFDGSAWVDRELDELAVVPELTVNFDEHVIELDRAFLWDTRGELQLLYELDSGETIIVEWSRPDRALRLRGANGSRGCRITADDRLNCRN